jgi:hypothetical protein
MTAFSTIRRMLRFGNAPKQYDDKYFSDMAKQLNEFSFRETQPYAKGWSTGIYTANSRGPVNSATVTLSQLSDIVQTLIDDLKTAGKLSS